MQEMWNRIFTAELIFYVKDKSGETEDFDTLNGFINHIKQRLDYKIVVMLATKWHEYDDLRQANIAIHYAGIFHASRFILVMDYLSKQYQEGKLR